MALFKRKPLPERQARTPAAAAAVSAPASATRTVDPPAAADPDNGAATRQDPPAGASGERPAEKQGSDRSAADRRVDGADAVRSRIASIVWLVAAACALTLAVGTLMVALQASNDNSIVSWVKDTAHTLDLGVFSLHDGIFTPRHDPELVKAALINWGIAAVLYLMVGKLADRIIRP